MITYAYRTIKTDIAELEQASFVDRLNQLGAEGWRLVSAVAHERHGYSHEVNLIFMRPLAIS